MSRAVATYRSGNGILPLRLKALTCINRSLVPAVYKGLIPIKLRLMRMFRDEVKVLCNDPELVEQMRKLLAGQVAAGQVFCEPRACSEAPLCRWLAEVPLGQAGRVQSTLLDVIDILHNSRHAFKSKAVAQARRRLDELLRELSDPA